MSRPEPELEIKLPVYLWRDLVFCLGPHGVGWGEYSVESPKEENFIAALKRIEEEVERSPFKVPTP